MSSAIQYKAMVCEERFACIALVLISLDNVGRQGGFGFVFQCRYCLYQFRHLPPDLPCQIPSISFFSVLSSYHREDSC